MSFEKRVLAAAAAGEFNQATPIADQAMALVNENSTPLLERLPQIIKLVKQAQKGTDAEQ